MQAFKAQWYVSSTVYGAVALVFVQVYMSLNARTPGFNLWPDLVTGLSASSIYTGALASGFGAYESSQWHNAQSARLRIASRSNLTTATTHFLVIAVPLIVGYCVTLIVLSIVALVTDTYGSASFAWLTALGCAELLSVAVGYAAGALLPARWFVAPAVVIGFYVTFVISRILPLPNGIRGLFPVITNGDSVFNRHYDATIACLAIFFLAAAGALIVITSIRRPRVDAAIAIMFSTCGVIAVIAGSSFVVHQGQFATGYNPRDFVCKDATQGATLCLNRGYSAAMRPALAEVDGFNSRAAGTSLEIVRLEQNVEGIGDAPRRGSRSLYLEQLAASDDIPFAFFRYAAKYGGQPSCGTNQERYFATLFVDSWLSGYYGSFYGDTPGMPYLDRLRHQTTFAGNRWLREHFSEYERCQLTLSEFP